MSHPRPRDARRAPSRSAPARTALLAAAVAAMIVVSGPAAGPTAWGAQEVQEPPATQPATQPAQEPATRTAQEPETQPTTQPTTAPARNNNGPPGIERSEGGLVLNFRDASIDVVLDELSAAAGFIIVREAKPTGRVTLTSRQPVSPTDAVVLINTVLHNNGYTAIQQGRILKIVESARAKKLNIPVRSGNNPDEIDNTDELITQVIPLRHADAVQLKEDLAPLINPEADFTANASSNALVMTDTAANVRRIVQVIAALDTALADSVEVKVFQLEYANAAEAADLINTLFGSLEVGPGGQQGGNPQEMVMRMMQGQRGGGRGQQQGTGGARGARVNAAADDRTNTLVVTGPGDTLEYVSQVVAQLDENPVGDETVFVYRLRNAQAANVESVINNLFGNFTANLRTGNTGARQSSLEALQQTRYRGNAGGRGGATGGLGGGGGGLGGGGQNANQQRQQQLQMLQQQQMMQQQMQQQQRQQQGGGGRVSSAARQAASDLAGQVTIIADIDTNSLLVRTSPANYERVKAILQELDRPVAQVLIKVLIAEVTHDDSFDIGTEFSVLNMRASGFGQQGASNFNIPTDGASATGLVVQILEQDFTATIRALETIGKLDVLSRPYILASDNQVASITIGQEVPFITNSRITEEGGIINTIVYDDIGILLDVIPHINPDGLVILDVAPEISTLTGTSVPISELVSAPIIAKRSALSRVGVRTGQTIVIGGLMEDRKTQTINRIPILGSIPLIGYAFSRTQQTKVKTELLIFLTPHVAADPDQLKDMTEQEMEGLKLTPDAVEKGAFQEQMRGMERGDVGGMPDDGPQSEMIGPPATQPAGQPEEPMQPAAQPAGPPGRRRGPLP